VSYIEIVVLYVLCIVAESVVDTNYRISGHVQRKCMGNLIQDSAFMIEILTGIDLGTINEKRFL
jgi:hypothetical protein